MKIAGIDPALNNFGFALGTMTGDKIKINDISLCQTFSKKAKIKRIDDLRRARELYEAASSICSKADKIVVEIPGGSQSARAAFASGVCLGVISALQCEHKGDFYFVTPGASKEAATQSRHATKEEMIEWAHSLYPLLPWMYYRGKLQKKNEHMADAIAAINCFAKQNSLKMIPKV